ncbi:MAG TPA: hypothetical protein VJ801_10400 [Polyangia bacterium]|nr:hypothetical protein [Polyangia bacterium]
MSLDKTKDVTINGINFRIGRVPVRLADWIITQMLTKTFSEEKTYAVIQGHLLGACSVNIDQGDGTTIPLKIFDGGRWLVLKQFPDLEYDADMLHQLIDEALDFNVGPFFERLRRRSSAEPIPDTIQ